MEWGKTYTGMHVVGLTMMELESRDRKSWYVGMLCFFHAN